MGKAKSPPEALAEPPAETPPKQIECDPAAFTALAAAWSVLEGAEAELREADVAIGNLVRETGRLGVVIAAARTRRLRELVHSFAKSADVAISDDPTAGDALRYGIAMGVLDFVREFYRPGLERSAARGQIGVLRAQARILGSIIEHRKVHLQAALEHLVALEGEGATLPSERLQTTKLEQLQADLQMAANKIARDVDVFETGAQQGLKKQGAYTSHLPFQEAFKSVFTSQQ